MSNDQVIHHLLVSKSETTAKVEAPIESVDLADWVLNLPDAEYQRCAPGEHLAAGRTTTDDGRPMSINVEEVGGSLSIQHYVAEIHEPRHCQLVSLTDVQTPGGWTKAHVTWDMRVEPIDDRTSRLVNTVNIHPTQGFLDLLAQGGVSFDDAAAQQHAAVSAHNERETALFAISIARKAQTNLPPE